MSDGSWRLYDLEVDLIVSALPHLFVDASETPQPDSPLCIKPEINQDAMLSKCRTFVFIREIGGRPDR